MFKKNQKLTDVEIIDYSHEGLGVAKVDNITIFIAYAKIGQVYDVVITKVEKSYCFARIVSDVVLDYKCPSYKACGGCQVMHLSYEEQLDFKYGVVKNLANKNKVDTKINKVVGSKLEFNYRNKVQLPFAKDSEGRIYAGLYKKRSHDVIDFDFCYLQSKLVNDIRDYVCELLNEVKETVYDEDRHTGNLRHLYIRQSFKTNDIMICFVCNSRTIKNQKEIVKKITKKFKEVKSIVLNENTRRTNAVLGFKNYSLYNVNFIYENLDDLSYRISPNVFFQVNTSQAENMYNKIIEYSGVTKDSVVLDAYCGTGSITLYLAKYAKEVVGIEIVNPSIKSANINKKENNINNVSFICGDIKNEYKNFKDNFFDVVVVDPPRKGLDSSFINLMLEQKPKTLVYVSCNPATLMRDLKLLEEEYKVVEITPFDMFSQTYHVESVCKLVKK